MATFTAKRSSLNHIDPLTNDALMSIAPSVFAAQPWERMSEKYTQWLELDVLGFVTLMMLREVKDPRKEWFKIAVYTTGFVIGVLVITGRLT